MRQFENVATFLKIDKNHIAILSEKGELDIYFLPEASTLDEILDELQKQFPVVAQTLPAASIKREPEEELPAEQVKKSKKEDPTQKTQSSEKPAAHKLQQYQLPLGKNTGARKRVYKASGLSAI